MAEGYDMHVHTKRSDGHKNIEEVIQEAKEAGLAGIAITDHDIILPFKEAEKLSKKYEMEIIAGGEIGSILRTDTIEIYIELLVYFFDKIKRDNQLLYDMCKNHRNNKNTRMAEMVYNVNSNFGLFNTKKQIQIGDVEKKAEGAPMSRHHLSHVMVDKDISDDIKDINDAYKLSLDEDAKMSCHVPKKAYGIGNVLRITSDAGAVIAPAHLGYVSKENTNITDDKLCELLDPYCGHGKGKICAIEVGYPYYNHERAKLKHRQKLGMTEAEALYKVSHYYSFANRKRLIKLCGSDHHQRDYDMFGMYSTPVKNIDRLKQISEKLRA